jgi:carotenoid cleavage dioxygenase-like enzyme
MSSDESKSKKSSDADGRSQHKTKSSSFKRILMSIGLTGSGMVVALSIAVSYVFRSPSLLRRLDNLLGSWQETKGHLAGHIYLHGNYAPVAEEQLGGVPLEVEQGALPDDLDGLFVRNGPNPIPSQITKRYHWFDGHGMLHNVRFLPRSQGEQGHPSATYSNQFIPTPRYQIEKSLGKEVFLRVGEVTGLIGVIKILFMSTPIYKAHGVTVLTAGQANTHTIMYENKFLCCHEGGLPFEVQLDNDGRIVRAVGFEDFDGVLDYPVSAHTKRDPVTGNLVFHGYAGDPELLKRDGPIKVGEWDTRGKEVISYFGVSPGDNHTSFAHDVAFTKNWIIVFDSSVHFDGSKIMEANSSFFAYNQAAPLRLGLVPRRTLSEARDGGSQAVSSSDVVWIDTGAANALIHALNAWEEDDGTVVLWTPLGDDFDGSLCNASNKYHMTELRLNPASRSLVSKKLIDSNYNVEFGRVRDDCLGRFCRFGYAGILDQSLGGDGLFSGFTVWDMDKGELHKAVFYPNGEVGQEPVVIPKKGRNESNAVYMGTFIYQSSEKQSYFVLYDGENDFDLVAKLRVPYRVPYGFHGQWVTGHELRAHIIYHASKSP